MEKVSHLFVIFYFTYVTIIVPSLQQSGGPPAKDKLWAFEKGHMSNEKQPG